MPKYGHKRKMNLEKNTFLLCFSIPLKKFETIFFCFYCRHFLFPLFLFLIKLYVQKNIFNIKFCFSADFEFSLFFYFGKDVMLCPCLDIIFAVSEYVLTQILLLRGLT